MSYDNQIETLRALSDKSSSIMLEALVQHLLQQGDEEAQLAALSALAVFPRKKRLWWKTIVRRLSVFTQNEDVRHNAQAFLKIHS